MPPIQSWIWIPYFLPQVFCKCVRQQHPAGDLRKNDGVARRNRFLILRTTRSGPANGTAVHFDTSVISYGLAIFLLVLMAAYAWSGRPLGDSVINRLKNLQGVFIAGALYFVVVFHLTNLYFTKYHGVESFILLNGGGITSLFWLGQIILGSLVPLAMLYHPKLGKSRTAIGVACVLVVLGGLAQMYVTLIGGQAYPLSLFPGYQESSSFFDGAVHGYSASLPELLLGIGGFAVALILVAVAVKFLRFLPESLDNHAVDPHSK